MTSTITYQEISSSIATILTRHPQFEKAFQQFERLAWHPHKTGMIKQLENGSAMIAQRSVLTNKIDIVFTTSAELEE